MTNLALLGARLLIGALLIGGAVQKALSPGDAGGMLVGLGLPFALVWPALIYDALAGLALGSVSLCGPLPCQRRPIAPSPAFSISMFFRRQGMHGK